MARFKDILPKRSQSSHDWSGSRFVPRFEPAAVSSSGKYTRGRAHGSHDLPFSEWDAAAVASGRCTHTHTAETEGLGPNSTAHTLSWLITATESAADLTDHYLPETSQACYRADSLKTAICFFLFGDGSNAIQVTEPHHEHNRFWCHFCSLFSVCRVCHGEAAVGKIHVSRHSSAAHSCDDRGRSLQATAVICHLYSISKDCQTGSTPQRGSHGQESALPLQAEKA